MSVKNNIIAVENKLKGTSCKLVAVTKTQPVSVIREAYEAGLRIFGENRAQELAGKQKSLPDDIEWHMIGHLQRNKVKHIAPFVDLIHSVDSMRLLREINKQGEKINRKIKCLLQVYIAAEETKHGFEKSELLATVSGTEIGNLEFVSIQGLMGMGTFSSDLEKVRSEFQDLKALFDQAKALELPENIRMKDLSMGMTNDYMIAIEEGSTIVRVGTAIFGERKHYEQIR